MLLAAVVVCALLSHAARDAYSVLGVARTASDQDIKRAYRRLSLATHPDKNPSPDAKDRFVEIQDAYEKIADADKRRRYGLEGDGQYQGSRGGAGAGQQHSSEDGFSQGFNFHFSWGMDDLKPEDVLPSNSTNLSQSSLEKLVLRSKEPWLVLVYSHLDPDSIAMSPHWEEALRLLSADKPRLARLGRINVHTQSHVANYVLKSGSILGLGVFDIPLVVGVPPGCGGPACFIRFNHDLAELGDALPQALHQFVADQLLHLPRVPLLASGPDDSRLRRFIASASPQQVVLLAFTQDPAPEGATWSGGGTGRDDGTSIPWRRLAAARGRLLHMGRVHWRDSDAEHWQRLYGVTAAPALVVLRGPGSSPEALPLQSGQFRSLEQLLDTRGLVWQEPKAWSGFTAAAIGCPLGSPMVSVPGVGPAVGVVADDCLLVVGSGGRQLDMARRNLRRLAEMLRVHPAQRGSAAGDAALVALAAGVQQGQVQLVWQDAAWQPDVCRWYLRQAQAAAAANGSANVSDADVLSVCDSGGRLRAAATRLPGGTRWQRHSVALLALRPFGSGMQWKDVVAWSALHPQLGLLADAELDAQQLRAVAEWAADAYKASQRAKQRRPHTATADLPPPLLDDLRHQHQPLHEWMTSLAARLSRWWFTAQRLGRVLGSLGPGIILVSLVPIAFFLLLVVLPVVYILYHLLQLLKLCWQIIQSIVGGVAYVLQALWGLQQAPAPRAAAKRSQPSAAACAAAEQRAAKYHTSPTNGAAGVRRRFVSEK